MNENPFTITVSAERYQELLRKEIVLDLTVKTILQGASIYTYNDLGLTYKDDKITGVLNIIAPEMVNARKTELELSES